MSDHHLDLYRQCLEQYPDPICIVNHELICIAFNMAFINAVKNNFSSLNYELQNFNASLIFPAQVLSNLERCLCGELITNFNCALSNGIIADFRCWLLLHESNLPNYVILSFSINKKSATDQCANELANIQGLLLEANQRNIEMKAALRHQAAQNSEMQRRKDEFFATISHQLRNHLSPIRNAARFLQHKLPEESEIRWCITVIDRQVNQFSRLIKELLDLVQLESGQFELNKNRLPLSEIILQATEWIQPLLNNQQQTLELIQPDLPIWVDADFQRLSQAIEHLLHNAIYYSGVHGKLLIETISAEQQVLIKIYDYGREIPADLLMRIFNLHGEINIESEQTAEKEQLIGLAAVKRVIEFHGGTVQAMYLGAVQGNVRIIRLPIAPPPILESTTAAPLTNFIETNHASRILVVDDNEDVAISFGALLEVLGHDVKVVLDGHTALEIVREFMPQIVFLDIAMPDMDGYEVARRLRAEHLNKNLRLVAVTGYGQEHDAEHARRAGFDQHLLKPVDLKDLQLLLGH